MFRWLIILSLALFSAVAAADSLQTRLEQGIYQEETTGNLESAVKIYSEIIDTKPKQKPIVAQAYFRLAQCQKKLGKLQEAKQHFNKILSDFAAQTAVVAMAQSALNELAAAPIEWLDIPWEDGETLTYQLSSPSGNNIGAVEYTATESPNGNWRLQAYTVVSMSNMLQYSEIETTAARFSPIAAKHNHSLLGKVSATYTPEGVVLDSSLVGAEVSASESSKRTLASKFDIYDNEQIFHLIRRLPLTNNYRVTFKALTPMTGNIVPVTVSVEESEKVTLGLGTFDTYRVKLSMPPTANTFASQTFWVTKDASRYVIKWSTKQIGMELKEIKVRDASYIPTLVDEQVALKLSTPKSWRVLQGAHPDPSFKLFQYLLPDAMEIYGIFSAKFFDVKSVPGVNINKVVQGDINTLKAMLSGYTLLAEPKPITAGSLKALAFSGEYADGASKLQEYRVYTLGEQGVYWFVFRGTEEQIKQHRGDIDEIIASFNAK